MISRLTIQHFKALRSVTIMLGRFHVLIGPNDSGKTTILEAVAALARSVDYPLNEAFVGRWEGTDLLWSGKQATTRGRKVPPDVLMLSADIDSTLQYELQCRFAEQTGVTWTKDTIKTNGSSLGNQAFQSSSRVYRVTRQGEKEKPETQSAVARVHDLLSGVHFYRFVPSHLALPSPPDLRRRFRMAHSGFGLATCLDDILGDDRERFGRLEKKFCQIFPAVSSIKLVTEKAFHSAFDETPTERRASTDGKGIYVAFKNMAGPIPASQLSDGMLLVLAYLAVLFLPSPPRFLLIEEPENGVHPQLLRQVLGILRELVKQHKHTQVLLTTHSPYVVDLFKPEEVTLCRKEQDGSVSVRRLSESATVREQVDLFTLGEIWTAEGDDALVNDGEPAKAIKP